MKRARRPLRFWLALCVAFLVAGAGAGHALTVNLGSLTTPPAGYGSQPFTSYTFGAPSYNVDLYSPQQIDSITFTISPAAAGAIGIVVGGHPYACSNSGGNVTCDTTVGTQLLISDAVAGGNLQIAAAQ